MLQRNLITQAAWSPFKIDNTSLIETLNSSNLLSDWHLRIDVARVKEMMAKKEIHAEWIKGKEQVVDCLTKVEV